MEYEKNKPCRRLQASRRQHACEHQTPVHKTQTSERSLEWSIEMASVNQEL